jgi:hypothetical protein
LRVKRLGQSTPQDVSPKFPGTQRARNVAASQ